MNNVKEYPVTNEQHALLSAASGKMIRKKLEFADFTIASGLQVINHEKALAELKIKVKVDNEIRVHEVAALEGLFREKYTEILKEVVPECDISKQAFQFDDVRKCFVCVEAPSVPSLPSATPVAALRALPEAAPDISQPVEKEIQDVVKPENPAPVDVQS